MKTLALIALVGIWTFRIRTLLLRRDFGSRRFYLRMWLENGILAGCAILLMPSERDLVQRLLLLPVLACGFGTIATAVMYMWGVRR